MAAHKRKPILIMFGGISAEHEVSVVTGLQALEHADTNTYEPHIIYVTKRGEFFLLPGTASRKDFLKARRVPISFGADTEGGFVRTTGMVSMTIRPYAALLAFHGGSGESGQMQGLLEACGIQFFSCGTEGSVITMNKALAKLAVEEAGVKVVPGIRVHSSEVQESLDHATRRVIETLGLPVIVKPAHLGSSIGISIARNEKDLDKAFLEASAVDTEIVVERFLTEITEYNCAVKMVNGAFQASEVERPISREEILSFADKYERGGKGAGGMASLSRELPAKISETLRQEIQEAAKKIFKACRCQGMVRVDFMLSADGTLYLTEVNPIPGSLAYYLWEASGIPYQEQISEGLEEAVRMSAEAKGRRLDYASDIIERFVKGG